MDFLEELLILNNLYTLNKIADEKNLDDDEKKEFIKKYNKQNNRLFTPCKKYMIDDYKSDIEKYESSNDA
jgi:hypothetical protein